MSCFSQVNTVDSLSHVLAKAQGKTRFEVLDKLVHATWHNDADLAMTYVQQATLLAVELQSPSLHAQALNLSAWAYMYRGQFDSAQTLARQSLAIAVMANDSVQIGRAYNTIGSYYQNEGDRYAALYHYLLSNRIATKIQDTEILSPNSSNISVVYNQLGDFEQASQFAQTAVALSESSDDVIDRIWSKMALAGALHAQGKTKEEEELCHAIIALCETADEKFIKAMAYRNLGELSAARGDVSEATRYFNQSMALYVTMKSEDFNMTTFTGLGAMYADTQPDSSQLYFRQSIAIAQKKMRPEDMMLIYDRFIPFFEGNHQYDSVLHYQAKYIDLIKSQERERNSRTIKGVWSAIEEGENLRKLALQRSSLSAKKMQFNMALAIIILLVVLVFTIFLFYRSKQKINQKLYLKNAEISVQKRALENLNQEKNKLISTIAHDLRTPLHSVKGLITLIQMEEDSLEKERFMDLVSDSADRMTDMVNRILDVSVLESKKVNLRIEQVDLVSIMREVLINLDLVATKKNQSLTFVKNAETAMVNLDRNYFIQVVENLVSNAIKYSKSDTQIKLEVEVQAGQYRVIIKDQGPGIGTEEQRLLFQEFSTLSSHGTDGEKATGLGLSIAKKYVEAMNGKIWCESEVGVGSQFFIQFDQELPNNE